MIIATNGPAAARPVPDAGPRTGVKIATPA